MSENLLFDNLEIDPELDENKNQRSEEPSKSTKVGYYDRKLENRLKKYEALLKKHENINRIENNSQFLFVGNGGLENNISESFLVETFEKFGKLVDVVMPKKKSFAFVIYEDPSSTQKAIENLQAQVFTRNQTPISFYMFPVDRVPDSCEDQVVDGDLPPGLIYIQNYIDDDYSIKLVEFLTRCESGSNEVDLKKRRVRHFGFDFRYGTNDCDVTKPLTDPDRVMPELCNDLIRRMVADGLISTAPDQMTVNIYEPGHGIGPHIDNIHAFDDYIVSLSLLSSVLMEFKHENKLAKLLLEPNGLLVLKGESRTNWTHCIPERKHDVISRGDRIEVRPRGKRISLTFRKVKESTKTDDSAAPVELVLPKSDREAEEFEKSHVHQVYNQIAEHFSETRYSAWPGVSNFISSMTPYSTMLDVGCGNGKYLGLRRDLFSFGCDYSDQLIRICQEKNFNCFVSDCLRVSCKSGFFDYLICIAVLHHLSTDERRIKAIIEMNRVLKKGGRALITVWAKEQKYKEKESFYISAKKGEKRSESQTAADDSNVHTFGKEFEKKDVFVAWRLKQKSKSDNKTNDVYLRFYHVFEHNELEGLFKYVPDTRVVESFYEQGNWCVIFEKI